MTKKQASDSRFLRLSPLNVPPLMNNVISLFIQGIPRDNYLDCGLDSGDLSTLPPDQIRAKLADFVRKRLESLATFEYASWINGRMPFVTSRELQLWRLLQLVKFIWFWNLPDDENLAIIFNATQRKASSLASDFEARFRKTILYPVALRRIYELFSTTPLTKKTQHPKKKAWDGCVYRVEFERYLGYLLTLIADYRDHTDRVLIDACWWDKDEGLVWVPQEVYDIARSNDKLRELLFEMYRLPSDDTGG